MTHHKKKKIFYSDNNNEEYDSDSNIDESDDNKSDDSEEYDNDSDIDEYDSDDIRNIIFKDIDDKYAYGKLGNFKVMLMKKNGYINATKLCKDAKKEFSN